MLISNSLFIPILPARNLNDANRISSIPLPSITYIDSLLSTISVQRSQLLSQVQLFATPRTAACQVSMSITSSQRLLKLMSRVSDAIKPSHPLMSPSPAFFNLSRKQGLFQ